MKAEDLRPGITVVFTPTSASFIIAKVTDKRVSWYLGFSIKSSWGRNTMRMASTSRKVFERGIANGSYKLPNE